MTDDTQRLAPVIQADRDMAAKFRPYCGETARGEHDIEPMVQAFARHRLASTDTVTALAEANEKLRADLKYNADAITGCEACGAPLFDADDFVEDDCAGCWAAMTDCPDDVKQQHPCYAYRVGKPDARAAMALLDTEPKP